MELAEESSPSAKVSILLWREEMARLLVESGASEDVEISPELEVSPAPEVAPDSEASPKPDGIELGELGELDELDELDKLEKPVSSRHAFSLMACRTRNTLGQVMAMCTGTDLSS